MSKWMMLLFVYSMGYAHAAEIKAYHNCGYGFPNCIMLRGEIENGDYLKLKSATNEFMRTNQNGFDVVADPTALFLDSPGGNVEVGMQMITLIVMRWSMATIVPENAICASMCANIWLTGQKSKFTFPNIDRYLAPSGSVGFHTTYTRRDGRRSKQGNDEVKWFYDIVNAIRPPGKEDLTEATMKALLAPGPHEMLWLTPEVSKKLGIEYKAWPPPLEGGKGDKLLP